MATSPNKTFGTGKVQVFELTMDNDENQDELNRRLRKPGEPGYLPPEQRKGLAEKPSTDRPPPKSE